MLRPSAQRGVPQKVAVIPPPAKPPSVKRGSKKVTLVQPRVVLSNNPTDSQLSNARVFGELLVPTHTTAVQGENEALAKALTAFHAKTNPEEVSDLTGFLAAYPKSRWLPAVELNLGLRRFETGYLTDALTLWKSAWESTKDKTDSGSKEVADAVVGHLVLLEARLGRKSELDTILSELDKRSLSCSAKTRVEAAKVGLACMKGRQETAFKCGPFAVDTLVGVKTGKTVRSPLIFDVKSTDKGTNLAQLNDWASALGLKYQMAKRSNGAPFLVPSILHWKLDHFATIVRKEKDGRYRIKDPTFDVGGNIAVTPTALETETDGYFLVPAGPLPRGWQSVGKAEAEAVWGKGYAFLGTAPGPGQPKTDPGGGGSCKGLARAKFYSMQATLNIQDVPLEYSPPIGPKMDFLASFDDFASNTISNPPFPNFGSATYWTFSWVSYLTVDGSSNVTIRTRGGGSEYYPYPYQTSLYTQAVLTNPSSGVYERQLPDGSLEIFNQADGAGRIFMTEVRDPQGNAATIQYDSNFRITSITDAIGQQTTLTYGSNTISDPMYYVITQITDPFSRSCSFTYTSTRQLASITDVMGMTSQFHYNQVSNFVGTLDWMTTPYGTTGFCYYAPATGVFPNRSLQFQFPDGTTSVIVNILWIGETYYWDREAMKRYPADMYPVLGAFDYSHAVMTKWCFAGGPFPDYSLSAAPQYIKPPLENQITFTYPGGSVGPHGEYVIGSINQPSSITRTISGSTTQTWQYTYNSLGHVTQEIDPVGREFTYTYASNGIDLLEKDQTQTSTADINGIWSSYSQHLPGSYKDGSGRVTSYTYNGFGELLTRTDPNSDVWTYTYDSDGYLTQINGPLSGSSDVTTISYDGYGRVYQVTDSEGYALTYSYDAMNRQTQVTHPDGTSDKTGYDRLDTVFETDRLGRCTQRAYDSMGQKAFEIDPLGRKTQYNWCACGSLHSLIDPNGNKTSWSHDLEGREIKKSYADQTPCTYAYDNVGRKSSRTDANGQTTNYSYNLDNTLYQITYSNVVNPTSTVTHTYDSNYLRLSTFANGWGTVTYSYNPYITSPSSTTTGAGKVSGITNSVISNSNVSYTYDVVGRMTNRSINGSSNSTTWAYDAMSRVTSETNPLGTFTYAYVDDVSGSSKGTTRLSSITYPNSQVTHFNWFGNLGDQRLQGILNLKSDGTCISQFNYGYDSAGQITSWQQQQGLINQQFFGLEYDLAGQLVTAKSGTWETKSAPYTSQYIYSYDKGANRIGTQQWAQILAKVDGSVTPGDTVTITVFNAGLPGGQEPVNYVVQSGDDLVAVASGLNSALQSNTNLQAIGLASDNFGTQNILITCFSPDVTNYVTSTSSGATVTVTMSQQHTNPWINSTVVGTPTTGDVLTIAVHDPALSGGTESVSYTVQSGDGLADIALGLANAVNGNTNLAGISVSSWYTGTTAQLISYSANVTTYTQSVSTGATENIVFSIIQNQNMVGSIAGTATAGDVLTVAVYDVALPGGVQTAGYTVQSGDGLNDIATGLANALNANSDIYSILLAGTNGSNLLLFPTSPTPTTFRATASSGSTATIVLGTTAGYTGAAFGSTQCQYNNVNELVSIGSGGVTQYQATTNKAVKSGSVATNALALKQSAPNPTTYSLPEYSSATTTIALANVLNGNVDATVSGSVTTGNVLSIIVRNASLTNGQEQVNYTVQSGDTLTTIAAGLSTAISANANLTALGISSTSSSATVSIAQPTTTYSSSNSSGATEFIGLGNNNNGNVVAEIGGSATPGDTVTLTVNNPVLSGGTESVTYTVQSGDDNIAIAEGVTALVNGNTNLGNIGITAQSDVPAVLDWSQSFKATQQTPGWNATSVSGIDGGNNSASAPYSVFGIAPTPANPTYDRNGNMTSDGTNSYLWDAENRLVEIDYPGSGNNSQFTYDGLGHWVKIVETNGGTVTGTKIMCWGSSEIKPLEIRDASNNVVSQFFDNGQTIGGGNYFYTKDHLGSIREMTDSSGTVQAQYGYAPYGAVSVLYQSLPADFRYAAMYMHERSGLHLTKYRIYNSVLGRWASRDPLGELTPALLPNGMGGGQFLSESSQAPLDSEVSLESSLARTANRQNLLPSSSYYQKSPIGSTADRSVANSNLYSYVGNDPICYVDSLGLGYDRAFCCGLFFGGCTAGCFAAFGRVPPLFIVCWQRCSYLFHLCLTGAK